MFCMNLMIRHCIILFSVINQNIKDKTLHKEKAFI